MSEISETTGDRRSGMRTMRRVGPYLWPEDNPGARMRVVIALVALLASKLAVVSTPFFYKAAVDMLTPGGDQTAFLLIAGAVGLTVAYGGMRLAGVGFAPLRDGHAVVRD